MNKRKEHNISFLNDTYDSINMFPIDKQGI